MLDFQNDLAQADSMITVSEGTGDFSTVEVRPGIDIASECFLCTLLIKKDKLWYCCVCPSISALRSPVT
jgi:hypothetical protein